MFYVITVGANRYLDDTGEHTDFANACRYSGRCSDLRKVILRNVQTYEPTARWVGPCMEGEQPWTTTKKYRRIYAMLKRAGHSPAKAVEIILDAKRNQARALYWIRIMHAARR